MAEQDLPYTLDYEALVKARGTLKRAADALYYHNESADEALKAKYQGMCVQALRGAENATYEVLSVLAHYGEDSEALRVIHMTEWSPAPMTPEEEIEETHRRR